MEELTDYEFPFNVGLIGADDFNDRFLILLLAQNGYKVKHFILGSKKDKITELNELYCKFELHKENSKKMNKLIEECTIVIINDIHKFEQFANLDFLKDKDNKSRKMPLVMNQKFEVFMPNLNCFYSIFDDKEMLSFSGILSSFRPYHEYIKPYVPIVNIFEIFLKGIFIGMFVNLSIYNKLKNENILEVVNKPFP